MNTHTHTDICMSITCAPDEQGVMQQVVPGMSHEMSQLGSFGVGGHNPPASQKRSTHSGLALHNMMAFPTLQDMCTTLSCVAFWCVIECI